MLPETNGDSEGLLSERIQKASLASLQGRMNWPTRNRLGGSIIYISDMEGDDPTPQTEEGRKWPASHNREREKNWVTSCIAGRLEQHQ